MENKRKKKQNKNIFLRMFPEKAKKKEDRSHLLLNNKLLNYKQASFLVF